MRLSVDTLNGFVIVRISGAVDRHAAGLLLDTLVQCIGDGLTRTIVDLTGVHLMTRAGVRGLIVAARLVRPGKGAMRISGANRQIADFLNGLGLDHLLKIDPSLSEAMTRMRAAEDRPDLTPAKVVTFGSVATVETDGVKAAGKSEKSRVRHGQAQQAAQT